MKPKNFEIGIDIENIERFANKNYHNSKNFLNKIFTKNELEECFSKENAASHLAVRYAAKEAVIKALSGLTDSEISYNEIEIRKKNNGMPYVVLQKNTVQNFQIRISLSHNSDNAIAVVVIYDK